MITRKIPLFNKMNFYFKCSQYDLLCRYCTTGCNINNVAYKRNRRIVVLSSGAKGVSSSIMIDGHFPFTKCSLINCGEGTRRATMRQQFKMSSVNHIFITSNYWRNIGGINTIIDVAKQHNLQDFKIHGPSGIKNICEGHLYGDNTKVKFIEYTEQSEAICSPEQDYYMNVYPLQPTSSITNKDLKLNNIIGPTSLIFLCIFPETMGMFSIKKCVEHNVSHGPSLLKLKRGETVQLDDGRTITPEEVRENGEPGHSIMFLEIPTENHMEALNEKYASFEHHPDVIVHFTPNDIFTSESYQCWLKQFPNNTKHMINNNSSTCLGMKSCHEYQHQLNFLSKEIFPLLSEDCLPMTANDDEHVAQSFNGLVYSITDSQFNRGNLIQLTPEDDVKKCYDVEDFESKVNEHILKFNAEKNENSEYPHVVFLGTVSSRSTSHRNEPAILLNISKNQSVLLDCGEGTIIQLMRYYGVKEANNVLRNLSAIFISHYHIDHQYGLFGILTARQRAFLETGDNNVGQVSLLCPPNVTSIGKIFPYLLDDVYKDVNIIPNLDLTKNSYRKQHLYRDLLQTLDMDEIETTFVKHVRHTYAIAFTHRDNWKIVYSSDTQPCPNLIQIGRNCDLLIHEATFDNHLKRDAVFKGHSTVDDAIQVSYSMNAKELMLTHFSVRYSNMPILDDRNVPGIGVAFDNMKIRLGDTYRLHHLFTAISNVFNDAQDENKKKLFSKLRNHRMKSLKSGDSAGDVISELYDTVYK